MSKDAGLTLKVLLQANGSVKAMRFGLDMTIGEIIKEIRVKNEIAGKDLGIFLPSDAQSGRKGQWLVKSKPLREYNLKDNVCILIFNF